MVLVARGLKWSAPRCFRLALTEFRRPRNRRHGRMDGLGVNGEQGASDHIEWPPCPVLCWFRRHGGRTVEPPVPSRSSHPH